MSTENRQNKISSKKKIPAQFITDAGIRIELHIDVLFSEMIFWTRCLFKCSQKSTVKKSSNTQNTVSCSSRCFWVSRRLMSFLESSEQISRFGAACKKPPPKRRFLVHQQGLEPGTRWLRVSCSNNSNRLRETHQLLNQFNLLNCCIMKIRPCRIFQ